jgi:hypothetical protein
MCDGNGGNKTYLRKVTDMPEFSESERRLLELFSVGTNFVLDGRNYEVALSGKPTCSRGEPKTDVFVQCRDCLSGEPRDIKISYKQPNADFFENKIKAERAREIFGPHWVDIIKSATMNLRHSFESRRLVYKEQEGRTERGAITLGWKFELLNRLSGELSGIVPLTDDQKIDVFAGNNLDCEKRDALVNGMSMPNSGVANYMLVTYDLNTAREVIRSLIPVAEYARDSTLYFACKALNFRSLHSPQKWDGDRPLAVQVDWIARHGKLTACLDFDHPLTRKGNEVGEKLKIALQTLGVRDTRQLNAMNCSCL